MDDPSTLVAELQSEIGDGLRVVAEYSDDGYDIHYVRDGTQPRIEEKDTDHIHQELVLQGIGREYLEDLFDAGRLQCSVHRFDEVTACHFVETETTGGFVSFDSDTRIRFKSFVETCKQHL